MAGKDRIFESLITEPGDFVFDERVVRVFPDMINRSVPGYGLVVPMIGILARRYAQAGSNLYDLGCSLGAVSLAMRSAVNTEKTQIIAVDNSADMINRLTKVLHSGEKEAVLPVKAIHQDILDTCIENASFVVLNFTLQFIERDHRQGLLDAIAAGLKPGGVLVLSEKIVFDDPAEQALQASCHLDFKRAQGYSELEIARKRDALENVMKPDSLPLHKERLQKAGFKRNYLWFQGFNFISLIAFR